MNRLLNVLVVDDDPQVCLVIGESLKTLGCEVTRATSAQEAMKYVRTRRYDFALVDAVMPENDGIFLLGLLKSKKPDMPVIIYSGKAKMEMAVDAFRMGAADFIEKLDVFDRMKQLVTWFSELADKGVTKEKPGKKKKYRQDLERSAILAALERTRWNQKKAAQLVGMSYSTFRRRVKKYGLI
ncbi:MAG: response regulator [Deltaproteobacteria bacterium]|nr:response regulator [Deltaproteobacteria bacterium]